MFKNFPFDLGLKPKVFLAKFRSSGRTIKVIVPSLGSARPLTVAFERKIAREDVHEGKLIPRFRESIKRRGGKQLTRIDLTPEEAEALYIILKPAIKTMQRRKLQNMLFYAVFNMIAAQAAHR
jgi:hypothetical protein